MKVSIVIPCHNVAEHLPTCLNSALASSFEDTEIICIDDGSSDPTSDVIHDFQKRYPGKIQSDITANQGASAARNRGMERATGDLIQFLDGDDVLMKHKIRDQISLIEATGRVELVIGNYEKKFMDGTRVEVKALSDDPWMALIRTELGTTSANLWDREMLMSIGGWDEDLKSSQDYELMFRMLKNGANVVFDDSFNTLILKREKGSISRTGQKDNWLRYIYLRVAIRDHLASLQEDEYTEHIVSLDQYIFMALRVLARFDVGTSIDLFKNSLGSGFKPERSKAIDGRYLFFYRLLGYPSAERIIQVIKRSAA